MVVYLFLTEVFFVLFFDKVAHLNLKLQSVTFTSLSPSMFENLELQFLAELSSYSGVVIRCSSTASALMF